MQSIEPPKYTEDLYAVLGVSLNASKAEVKQAYHKIAYSSHPDRNTTLEANYVFQNATYAYRVLGKDASLRAEYDAKYRTRQYLGVMEKVSSEVIEPFATQVALPFLNLTFQSFSKKALPFVSDVFEQSSAAMKAIFDFEQQQNSRLLSSNTTDGTGPDEEMDVFARTSQAVNKMRYEQKRRDLLQAWQTKKAQLEGFQQDFQRLQRDEQDAIHAMNIAQQNESLVLQEWRRLQLEEEVLLKEVKVCNDSKNSLLEDFRRELETFEGNRRELSALTTQEAEVKQEILLLEQRLRAAKGLLMELQEKEIALIQDLAVREGEVEDYQALLDLETEQLADKTASLETVQAQSRVWQPIKDDLLTKKSQLVLQLATLGDQCIQRGKEVQDCLQDLEQLQRSIDSLDNNYNN